MADRLCELDGLLVGFSVELLLENSHALLVLPDGAGTLSGTQYSVGPTWRNTKDGGHKFIVDCEHASPLGEYLIGCVWFEVIFGKDAREIRWSAG